MPMKLKFSISEMMRGMSSRRGETMIRHHAGDNPPDLFIDCGVGNKTEAWSIKTLYPDCKIVGFEPHPGIYQLIRSSFPGLLLPVGLASEQCTKQFLFNWGDMSTVGSSGIYRNVCEVGCMDKEKRDVTLQSVECITLDEFFAQEPELIKFQNAFLWCDCEGAEYDIFLGAKKTLRKTSFVQCEVRPKDAAATRGPDFCSSEDVERVMQAHDFVQVWEGEIHKQGHSDRLYKKNVYPLRKL